jgi:DUF1680 family protein
MPSSIAILLLSASALPVMRPHKLVPLPLTAVKIEDSYWRPRIEVNRTRTLETVRQHLIETGAIDNFAIAAARKQGQFRGPFWSDSDVYKWLEGVSNSLALEKDAALEGKADDVISLIGAAQQPDGYLDTYFQLVDPDGKWTNLAFGHEDFNAGHLLEAAVAHFEATGKRTLLDIAIRSADCFERTFGPGKREGQPGHEGLELALVKLSRATGDKRYLKLAEFYVNNRGQRPSFFEREYQQLDPNKMMNFLGRRMSIRGLQDELFRHDPTKFDTQYSQDHLPVRKQDKVVGHAVRAMYLYSGMADVASETGDESLYAALLNLYRDMTSKRMYVTGGVGPSASNEGFSFDYDLPNETAYQETCASIGVAMWTQRMLGITGDARYADMMELALYNALPAGVSLAGDTFFYDNPLYSAGKTERRKWFSVPCCPTNVVRVLPSISKYAYSQSEDGLWVNLYIQGRATAKWGGDELSIEQTTNYPWSGDASLRVAASTSREQQLFLRIPGWAGTARFTLNGKSVQPAIDHGYAQFRRKWAAGDTIRIAFPMDVQRLQANPAVAEDRGRIALRRGPIIYCLEQADQDFDLDRLYLPADAKLEAKLERSTLSGIAIITGQARRKLDVDWSDMLYRPADTSTSSPVSFRAVPYSVWNNRGPGKMTVWIEGSPR